MTRRRSGAAAPACLFAVGAASFILVAQAAWGADAAPPPALNLLLEPHASDEVVDYLDVDLTIEEPQVQVGRALLRMPLLIASIPTMRYDAGAIRARDSAGELQLTMEDEPATSTGSYRQWRTSRATVGDVCVEYRAVPRAVSADTRPGPLFDLRTEAGGLNGAGIAFLALPDTIHPYRVHLQWDLSAMPKGSRGVWSFGEGEVRTVASVQEIAFSYYAAGPMKSFPAAPANQFAMYWFSEPPFDTGAVATKIQKLYAFMAPFFRDAGSPYRVFIRRNPYPSGGGTGTALARSFVFGYGEGGAPAPEKLQSVLSHEMAHNWLSMQGEHAETAWYLEGAAEYYSILSSHRAGLLDLEGFQKAVNERAFGYYTNPLQSLTNTQAAQRFWNDGRAQRVPYGRGFIYLARVDAQIRAKSGGKRSLDDIVLAMRERQVRGERYGIAEWRGMLTAEIGPAARAELDSMIAGIRMTLGPAVLAPCFRARRHDEPRLDLGFDVEQGSTAPAIVHGLVPDSTAARAGLREGDELMAPVFVRSELVSSPEATLTLKLRRDSVPLEITYLPRGAEVESYRWERVRGVSHAACAL